MKNTIKIDNKKLLEKLNEFRGLLDSKVIYNIESNVKLQVKENKLYITATDGATRYNSYVEIENIDNVEYEICIFHKKLYEIIKQYKTGDTSFTLGSNEKLTLQNGTNKGLIIGMSVKDYPILENRDYKLNFELTCDNDTRQSIKKVSHNVGGGGIKPMFENLYINTDNGLMLTGRDGRSLTQAVLNGIIHEQKNILIDPFIFYMLFKNVKKNEVANIYIHTSEDYIEIIFKDISIQTPLIDSKYPDIKFFLEQSYEYKCEVNIKELKQALKQVLPMVKELATKKTTFIVENKKMYISTVNENIGQSQVEILDSVNLPDFQVGFRHSELNRIVKDTKNETLILQFNTIGNVSSKIGETIIMPVAVDDNNIKLLDFDIVFQVCTPLTQPQSVPTVNDRIEHAKIEINRIEKPIKHDNNKVEFIDFRAIQDAFVTKSMDYSKLSINNPFKKDIGFIDKQIKSSYYYRHFRAA